MSEHEPGWLDKTQTIVGVALPKVTGEVAQHRATIPKATRRAKLYLTLLGVACCLAAYVGWRVGWSSWAWGTLGFFGANYIAGDYRRLVFRSLFAILSDTADFVTRGAAKVREIKDALLSLKNGKP